MKMVVSNIFTNVTSTRNFFQILHIISQVLKAWVLSGRSIAQYQEAVVEFEMEIR